MNLGMSALPLLVFLANSAAADRSPCPLGGERRFEIEGRIELLCRYRSDQAPAPLVHVSPICLTSNPKKMCGAIRLLDGQKTRKDQIIRGFMAARRSRIDASGGKNPAALLCSYREGTPYIGTSPAGSQDTVCRARDGSLILAWDLFNAFDR
jgi:hypothetical protein